MTENWEMFKFKFKTNTRKATCATCRFCFCHIALEEYRVIESCGSHVTTPITTKRYYCRRFPNTVERKSWDWCGEYKALKRWRNNHAT